MLGIAVTRVYLIEARFAPICHFQILNSLTLLFVEIEYRLRFLHYLGHVLQYLSFLGHRRATLDELADVWAEFVLGVGALLGANIHHLRPTIRLRLL